MSILLLLDKTLRSSAPKLAAVALVLVSVQPLSIPGITHFMPMVEVLCIYYWALHAPLLFPAWFAFLLGVLKDALYGTPLGMTALPNLLLLAAILSQRKFLIREPFWVQWCSFLLLSLAVMLIKALLALTILPAVRFQEGLLIQWLFTLLLYVPTHYMFNRLHHAIIRGNRYAQ